MIVGLFVLAVIVHLAVAWSPCNWPLMRFNLACALAWVSGLAVLAQSATGPTIANYYTIPNPQHANAARFISETWSNGQTIRERLEKENAAQKAP